MGLNWDKLAKLNLFLVLVLTQTACSVSIRKKISSALGLTSSEYTFQGKWLSQCEDLSTGEFGKIYLDNDTENHGTAMIYYWGNDSTCSGGYISSLVGSADVSYPELSVTGVDSGYYVYDAIDASNPGNATNIVVEDVSSGTIRLQVVQDADVPGATFADWKVSSADVAGFVAGTLDTSNFNLTYYSVAGPPTKSTSAEVEGRYEGACIDNGTDGIKLAFKIKDGLVSTVLKFYTGNRTCGGTYNLVDMVSFAPVAGYVADSNIDLLYLTGGIAGMYGTMGYDLVTFVTSYSFLFKVDANHLRIFSDDTPVTTNPGSAFADWTAADADLAGFIADPSGYDPGGDIANYLLTKSPALHSFDGKWLSACWDYGGGNYGKLYEVISNNNASLVSIYSWGADATCSGNYSSVIPITTDMDFALNSVMGVPEDFSVYTTTDNDNGSGQSISIVYQDDPDEIHIQTLGIGSVTTNTWRRWKNELASIGSFENDPTASASNVLHFSRVSGPPSIPGTLSSFENSPLFWGAGNSSAPLCSVHTVVSSGNTYQSYFTYSYFKTGDVYYEGRKYFANADCTGAQIYYDLNAAAEIAAPDLNTNTITFGVLNPTGMPAGLYARSMVLGGNTYYLVFNANAARLVYLAFIGTPPADPNDWSTYEAAVGAGNMSAFLADPLTYNSTLVIVYWP